MDARFNCQGNGVAAKFAKSIHSAGAVVSASALELTEQGTRIADAAGGVTDEAWANAVQHYDDDQLVSLIALINTYNRINVGKQRGWWQDYDLPYATFVGLEAEAASISVYQSGAVPGLLQIEEYARAMLEAGVPPLSDQELEQRVQARLTRQSHLIRPGGPRYHAILDEAALHRRVGGPQVMRAQLQQIVRSAQLANVSVRVVSFETGAHPAMESIFTVLSFEQPLISDIVYVEGLVGNIYLERSADLARYREIYAHLDTMALRLMRNSL